MITSFTFSRPVIIWLGIACFWLNIADLCTTLLGLQVGLIEVNPFVSLLDTNVTTFLLGKFFIGTAIALFAIARNYGMFLLLLDSGFIAIVNFNLWMVLYAM